MRAYAQVSVLGDRAREKLITEHLESARRLARRMARRTSLSDQADDVVGVAMVGLVEAANRYEPSQGEMFWTFAQRRIRGAVLDELRRKDVLPRRVRRIVRDGGDAARKIEHEAGRPAEDDEVASAIGVSTEKYQACLEAATNISFVDLDGEDGLQERLTSEETSRTPADVFERRERAGLLKEALHRIPERDARILSLYYVEEFTYAEIASLLSVSAPRVCQLHARALTRLRSELCSVTEEGRAA